MTLHNQALMNMEANPTAVKQNEFLYFFVVLYENIIDFIFFFHLFQGFEKLQFLLQQNPFPPGEVYAYKYIPCNFLTICSAYAVVKIPIVRNICKNDL